MTSQTDALQEAADRLWNAAAQQIGCSPIRDLVTSIDDAYEVQRRNVDRVTEGGDTIIGRKIGLTSEAVQEQLGVDQPDYGSLFASRQTYSGQPTSMDRLLQPRAEAEIVLVLGADLTGPHPTIADIAAATDHVLPALEIVDSRIADWNITLVDTIADNASCGGLVLGTEPVPLDDVDLVNVAMTMTLNGETCSEGIGADCLGNPLIAAQWVASTMVALGTPLRAGDLVLTGALGPMASVKAGDVIVAELSGLGRVSTTFEASA